MQETKIAEMFQPGSSSVARQLWNETNKLDQLERSMTELRLGVHNLNRDVQEMMSQVKFLNYALWFLAAAVAVIHLEI